MLHLTFNATPDAKCSKVTVQQMVDDSAMYYNQWCFIGVPEVF